MSAQPPPAFDVTPADVAVWLRARTQDDEGREQGVFTEATRPSNGQVEQAIDAAHTMVALRVGWQSPEPCLSAYRYTVALAAACIIEKSYFPEQIADSRSAYVQLNDELTQAMEGLYQCVVDGGLGPGASAGGQSESVYDFRTPRDYFAEGRLLVPANWNNPYAYNVDDPYEPSAASAWLLGQQAGWAGEVDAQGNPITNGPETVDTRPPHVGLQEGEGEEA